MLRHLNSLRAQPAELDETTKWALGSNTGGGGPANQYLSTHPLTITDFDLIFFIQVFKTRRQRVKTLDSVSCGTICTVGGAMEARF